MDLIRIAILAAPGPILVTSVWVLIDARLRRVPTRGNTYEADTGALAWFLGCLLLWPAAFPTYLVRRKTWGRRREQAAKFAAAEQRAASQGEVRPESGDLLAIASAQRLGGFDPVHLAPNIPARLLRNLTMGPLELEPGELLLAVIDPSLKMRPGRSWAVTTRRVVSTSPHKRAAPTAMAGGPKTHGDEFGPALADSLDRFVGTIQEEGEASLPAPLAEFAAGLAPELARQTERIHGEQRAVRDFRAAVRAATPHAFVTPVFGLACLGVFLAMIKSGVSAVNPDTPSLVDWGAMFGLRVALDHEYWRLFTAMFLHVGIIHLAANMACLAWLGPTIERFFGNLAFAAIYLLSGLGGSIASMAAHPTLAAAGASGAIFGVFGAIVGFLVARRRSIPRAILVPFLVAALVFIAGSLIAGAFEPRIDLAAHLGGLATGLACGLLLWRRLPAVPGRGGILRRLAAASAICLALAVAAGSVTQAVAREPEALAIIKQRDAASFDRLAFSILKLIGNHASMRRHAEHVLTSLTYQREIFGNDRVVELAVKNMQAFRSLSAEDDEQRAILATVIEAAEEVGAAAGIIKDAFDAEDTRLPNSHPSRWSAADHEWRRNLWAEAEEPLCARLEKGKLAMEKALALRDRYLKDHGLDEGLARLEPIRRRFREEEEQYRQMYQIDMPEAARNDLRTRQFRERMAELEAMMLEAEWSVRCSPGESE